MRTAAYFLMCLQKYPSLNCLLDFSFGKCFEYIERGKMIRRH